MNCKICNAPCRDEFCDDCAVLGVVHMIGHGVTDLQKRLASAVEVIRHYADKCKCGHSVNDHGAMLTCSQCICGLFYVSNNKAAEWLKENNP